ncbi:MAG: hypothetical protein Q9170_005368 [Blastenia crenularia]
MNFTALIKASLELHRHDVVYLVDACFDLTLEMGCGKELLAASACESPSVSGRFTRRLLELLVKQARKPITLAQIHARLLMHQWGPGNTTPVHTELNPDQNDSLVIAPITFSGTTAPVSRFQPSPDTPLLDVNEPKVIISVNLADERSIPDLLVWLNANRPFYIREHEVAVSSAHPSGSGKVLVLLMIPAAVHNALHGHPAYQLVGYVQQPNVLAATAALESLAGLLLLHPKSSW